MEWLAVKNNGGCVSLDAVPVADYAEFYDAVCAKLDSPDCHVANYFAAPQGNELVFFCLLADDASGEVLIASHRYGYYSEQQLESITARHHQMHPFEREIAELYGVRFNGNPWSRPLRFPHNRASVSSTMDNYPFYTIEGESLHEVNVGPIHAGIIEPGAFRFICNGERVLHLEIALGYQHRGVESLMAGTRNRLRQTVIAEAVAGDSVVAHTTAYAMAVEKLAGFASSPRLELERAAALELERVAIHIGDTGGLCTDIAYQLGQVASEALRTIVINTTQMWCGNRFGKGMIRPMGSNFPLTGEKAETILKNIADVSRRYGEVREDLKATPSLLARFEDCGLVTRMQMQMIGGVGQAARASGLARDVRSSHPWGAYVGAEHQPEVKEQGDIMARLSVRGHEVAQSVDYVERFVAAALGCDASLPEPDFDAPLRPSSLSFSLVEGWRGEICHVAITDAQGHIETYKVKDPSVHNWLALALAVRGEGISDFPICNKSFSLSYCGHDL